MNNRRKRFIVLFSAVVIAAVAGMTAVSIIFIHFRKSFVLQDNLASRQYKEKIPLHEMNMDYFSPYVYMDVPAVEQKVHFALPEDIVYYREVDGKKEEALVLSKGTLIVYQQSFCGPIGFPTYKKGWHYAVPFLPEKYNSKSGELPAEYREYYYVKLSSLEKAAYAWLKACGRDSKRRETYRLTRYIDYLLYKKGIYLSPDLDPLLQLLVNPGQ